MLEGGGGGGGGATGLLDKGGGSNRLPGLVTKQQAVEFPHVLTSIIIVSCWILTIDKFVSDITSSTIHVDFTKSL